MTGEKLEVCRNGYLAFLVFQLGAVSGATRRIVYIWQGSFTTAQIRRSLRLLYPGLIPSEFQVEDCIERMVWERRLKCVGQDNEGRNLYEVIEYEPYYAPKKMKQLKFSLES